MKEDSGDKFDVGSHESEDVLYHVGHSAKEKFSAK
jgi:hypothetical protein